RPSQQCFDARQELGKLEGLGQIVVRARIQTAHFVRDRGAGREHQHRRTESARSQLASDLDAVLSRESNVEDDEIRRMIERLEQSGFAVLGASNVESLTAEDPL